MNNQSKEDLLNKTAKEWQRLLEFLAHSHENTIAFATRLVNDGKDLQAFSVNEKNPLNAENCPLMKFGDGYYCEEVIQNKVPLLIKEGSKLKKWENSKEMELGFESYVGYPILNENQEVFGTLCLLSKDANKFTESDLEKLKTLADNITSQLELIHNFVESKNAVQKIDDKLSYVKDMTQSIAHDINNPLTLVQLLSGQLSDHPELKNNEIKNSTEKIKTASSRIKSLVEDLMAFTGKTEGKSFDEPQVKDLLGLRQYLETQFSDEFSRKRIEFRVDLKAEDRFNLDYSKLLRIIENLICNSLKFTHQGHCTVDIVQKSKNPLLLSCSIQDTGIGIDKAYLKDVFVKNSTLSLQTRDEYGGHGVGLSSVKNLVEEMNGTIEVYSTLGVGSTFNILLPG